jgi:acetate kinase
MAELARLGDPAATKGRVILAHLGNGASMAAVRDGKSIDTSMGFTPTSGLVMSSRSGDLDPGLVSYLARTEQMSAAQFQEMVNHASGLLGVSELSSDLRDLIARESDDIVQRKPGAFLLSGQEMDWVLRSGARWIRYSRLRRRHRRNAPRVRSRICEQLGFLGIELGEERNTKSAPLISTDGGRVAVRRRWNRN